ncbi:hypothetical protein D3C80_1691400 [compost metagenome]
MADYEPDSRAGDEYEGDCVQAGAQPFYCDYAYPQAGAGRAAGEPQSPAERRYTQAVFSKGKAY